jgi:hydroxymethylpyrimidine/phosphomethylpyrimidine kinase
MLYSREIMDRVVAEIHAVPARPQIVVDPVMVATSGDSLLKGDAVSYYKEAIFPLATLVTPNLDEAAVLVGRPIASLDELHRAGQELVTRYGCAFLMKGGHLRESVARDLLVEKDGTVTELSGPYVSGISTHGTGCTYSAAVASGLGRGLSLVDATVAAKQFISSAIGNFLRWEHADGTATDALHHFAAGVASAS